MVRFNSNSIKIFIVELLCDFLILKCIFPTDLLYGGQYCLWGLDCTTIAKLCSLRYAKVFYLIPLKKIFLELPLIVQIVYFHYFLIQIVAIQIYY